MGILGVLLSALFAARVRSHVFDEIVARSILRSGTDPLAAKEERLTGTASEPLR